MCELCLYSFDVGCNVIESVGCELGPHELCTHLFIFPLKVSVIDKRGVDYASMVVVTTATATTVMTMMTMIMMIIIIMVAITVMMILMMTTMTRQQYLLKLTTAIEMIMTLS